MKLLAFTEDGSRTWNLDPHLEERSPGKWSIVLYGPCSYYLDSTVETFPMVGLLCIDAMGRNFSVDEAVYVELEDFHKVLRDLKSEEEDK